MAMLNIIKTIMMTITMTKCLSWE